MDINDQIIINGIVINNRLVMPPMATGKARDGKITKEILDYYDEKTKGGCLGLVIVEHMYVNKQGMANYNQISISEDSDIAGLSKLVKVIHKNNSKVLAQISHAGSKTASFITGMKVVGPSEVKNVISKDSEAIPCKMTTQDIDNVINDFLLASKRAKLAGFDGVELHSAHGYLLNQFYSPITNLRDDEYGGSNLLSRIALHLKIIKAIRKEVGEDFIIALRLGACDFLEGGTTIEDSIKASLIFEENSLDLLDISGGLLGYQNPLCEEEGWFSSLSKSIKDKVRIPVILTGGFTNKGSIDLALKEEKADLIGVGRALLKDNSLPKKLTRKLISFQEVISDLEKIEHLKTKDLDSYNKMLIKNNVDVSSLKEHVLTTQLIHRTFFQVSLGLLNDYEEQFSFIEENEDLLQDWWHVDQLIQFIKRPIDFDFAYHKAKSYLKSDKPFVRRWGYVLFLAGLQKDCKNTSIILSLLKDDDEYYVQMAEAWLICDLAIYNTSTVVNYLEESKLKYNILGKAIQKICDSFRISSETKEYVKALREKLKQN